MNYFRCGGSEKVTIDGAKVRDKLELVSQNVNCLVLNKDSRVYICDNQMVVYNDVFYVLNHHGLYKSKNGSTWEKETEAPQMHNGWRAVVYNGEIHFFTENSHCKWNGTTWTTLDNLPVSAIGSSAVVFNDEIHILGGSSNPTKHYKWNGTTWTSVSTLPYEFSNSGAVVFNNEIHILGGLWGGNSYNYHYKWDGTTWTVRASLPYGSPVSAVVFNNEIHILGGLKGSSGTYSSCNKHYKYSSGSWTKLDDIVYPIVSGSTIYTAGVNGGCAFVYNNEIYVAGDTDSNGVVGNFMGYMCRIINAKVYRQ